MMSNNTKCIRLEIHLTDDHEHDWIKAMNNIVELLANIGGIQAVFGNIHELGSLENN